MALLVYDAFKWNSDGTKGRTKQVIKQKNETIKLMVLADLSSSLQKERIIQRTPRINKIKEIAIPARESAITKQTLNDAKHDVKKPRPAVVPTTRQNNL